VTTASFLENSPDTIEPSVIAELPETSFDVIKEGRFDQPYTWLATPGHRVPIIFEAFGIFEGILRRVHHQVPFVVVLVGELDRIEGNRDVLFARPKKAADADDERGRLAALIDKHVHDLADCPAGRRRSAYTNA
jgi:hypothetical protein